jgi:glycosyltransferase 2 family protein
VVVTWFIATRAGLSFDELRALDLSAWHLRWGLVAASCMALLLGFLTTGWLWGRIVEGLGGPSLPPAVAVRLFMIANLGRYVPGKVWQIAGLAALAKSRGVPATTAAAAAILGQGIALASATFVGLGAVWTLADGAGWRWAVPAALATGIVVGLLPPVFDALADVWFRLARTPRPERLRPSRAIEWLVVGLVSWVVYATAFWMLVESLGLQAAYLPTASAFAAAYVLGYVMVFAPAGIGVREGFLVALLSPQLGAGAAGAVAIIARLWTTLIEVLPAAAFWTRHLATTASGAPKPRE